MPDRLSLNVLFVGAGQKTAILDSNLLVPFISARLGTDSFRTFKRAKYYENEDMLLLAELLGCFRAVATTSAVLAEASNLANELTGSLRESWFQQLAEFGQVTEEAHISTQSISLQPELVRFGFTDAVLAKLADTHVLITADYRLAGVLAGQGRQVINFNQIQVMRVRS